MRKAFSLLSALALGVAASTLARPAAAQAFGNKGDITFAAERLMGLYFYDEGVGETNIGLAMAPFGAPIAPSFYQVPRLGVDYFIIDNLSIGGSLGFGDMSVHDQTLANGVRTNGGTVSGAFINPRVGYALEFNRTFGFWPRGGFTYRNFGGDEEFALTLEAMFYAAPVEHFAIILGPLMDLGIAGSGDEAKNFALFSGGLVGWL
jgi:hypothetical protein